MEPTLKFRVLSNIPPLGARPGDEIRVYGTGRDGVVEVYRCNVFPLLEAGQYLSGPEVEVIIIPITPGEIAQPQHGPQRALRILRG